MCIQKEIGCLKHRKSDPIIHLAIIAEQLNCFIKAVKRVIQIYRKTEVQNEEVDQLKQEVSLRTTGV